MTSTTDMKNGISTKGPLVTCFTVYGDFYAYTNGIYSHVQGNVAGGHCVLVVGHNDTEHIGFVRIVGGLDGMKLVSSVLYMDNVV